MTRNRLGNDLTIAGVLYAPDSDDDVRRHRSPDSFSEMEKSGWLQGEPVACRPTHADEC